MMEHPSIGALGADIHPNAPLHLKVESPQVKHEDEIKDSKPGLSIDINASDVPDGLKPPASAPPTTTQMNGPPRRPPRKSTLTQQQKNQKRQRATQDQLNTLEVEFNKNPTPSAVVRDRIAQEINMTERSVQIWFQNRRAKIKNIAKKSIETGEDCDAIPESMRRYLYAQAMESGKPFMGGTLLKGGGLAALGSGLLLNTDSAVSKVPISHLTCSSLRIGTWRRIGQTQLDLVVFYSPTKAMVTYYIQAEGSGFKIEYPFSSIKNITLHGGDQSNNAEGATQQKGEIVVELTRPPAFTMDQGFGGWNSCQDFTEDRQASQVLVHHLGGHPKPLASQLAKMVSLENFRNRHAQAAAEAMPVQAPALIAPYPPRPASQPNHFQSPQPPQPSVHEQPLAIPNWNGMRPSESVDAMAPPPPRGHKRQRSRSVPAAIDFKRHQVQPIPPFAFHQHHHIHFSSPAHHQHIYAPVPQYQPVFSQYPNNYNQVGQNLNIDTASSLASDITPGPMTATTATSPPSELEPSLPLEQVSVTNAPPMEMYQPQQFNTQNLGPTGLLSPIEDTASFIHSSLSPHSTFSTHESPAFDQSLYTNMGRSASADMINVASKANDDDISYLFNNDFTAADLNTDQIQDFFSTQKTTLAFRSPGSNDHGAPPSIDDFDFNSLVNTSMFDQTHVNFEETFAT